MRRLWNRLYGALTHPAYWEGINTGIGLGELFERDRVAEVIRDLFVDLPETTFTVSRPVELGEHIIREIQGRNDK